MERYHIEKNTVQETLVIPLYGRKLCTEMAKDGFIFYQSVNGVWLTKKVPVKYLEKLV